MGGGSCLAHTSATLHRSVPLLWLSSFSGVFRWFRWLAQVSPDNVKYSLMQLDEVNIEGLSPGGVVLAGAHACGQSSTCSSTKIGCASLSFPSPPPPVGFVFPSVFPRGLGYFILHHEMHSWLCIHGVISVGPVWRVTLHSSPPWQPTFPGLISLWKGGGRELPGPHFRHTTQKCPSSVALILLWSVQVVWVVSPGKPR